MSERFPPLDEHWCKTALDEVRRHLLRALPDRKDMTTVELAEMAADLLGQPDRFADVNPALIKLSTADRLPTELEEVVDRAVTQENYGWRRSYLQRHREG